MEQYEQPVHPNSRVVTIYRSASFLSQAQSKEVDDAYSQAARSIGSYFEGKGSQRIASGLSLAEEKVLLPRIIGMNPEEREFLGRRDQYFKEFITKIPHGTGVTLEIGLETDNKEALSLTNYPINPLDFIRYRHALGHPQVADSEVNGRGNSLKHFYIYDAQRENVTDSARHDQQDVAMQYYFLIKDDIHKVNMMLVLLGEDIRTIYGVTDEQTKLIRASRLRDLVQKYPGKVIGLSKDHMFEVRYLYQSLINTGILRKIGLTIVINETSEDLGTEEEALYYLKDEKTNNKVISILKVKLAEVLKERKKQRRAPIKTGTL